VKTFKNKIVFVTHQRTHKGLKQDECNECGPTFRKRKCNKKTHKYETFYECKDHRKTFNSKSGLHVHQRTQWTNTMKAKNVEKTFPESHISVGIRELTQVRSYECKQHRVFP
jgi:hypothetical protein